MQSVLEIELASPGHHVGKQVTVEGGVLLKQGFQIQRALRGHQLIQAHLMRGDRGPLLLHVSMVWVRADVADALKNHCNTLFMFAVAPEHDIVTIQR